MNNKYESLSKLVASTTFGGLNVFDFSDGSQEKVPCVSSKMVADEMPSIQQNHIQSEKPEQITPTIWCVHHLPQNRNIFVTCGGNGNIRLWQR